MNPIVAKTRLYLQIVHAYRLQKQGVSEVPGFGGITAVLMTDDVDLRPLIYKCPFFNR